MIFSETDWDVVFANWALSTFSPASFTEIESVYMFQSALHFCIVFSNWLTL